MWRIDSFHIQFDGFTFHINAKISQTDSDDAGRTFESYIDQSQIDYSYIDQSQIDYSYIDQSQIGLKEFSCCPEDEAKFDPQAEAQAWLEKFVAELNGENNES